MLKAKSIITLLASPSPSLANIALLAAKQAKLAQNSNTLQIPSEGGTGTISDHNVTKSNAAVPMDPQSNLGSLAGKEHKATEKSHRFGPLYTSGIPQQGVDDPEESLQAPANGSVLAVPAVRRYSVRGQRSDHGTLTSAHGHMSRPADLHLQPGHSLTGCRSPFCLDDETIGFDLIPSVPTTSIAPSVTGGAAPVHS
jgi:hypothetical protein